MIGLPALLVSGTFSAPPAAGIRLRCSIPAPRRLLAELAGLLAGRHAFGWLRGERYENVVLAVLAVTALVAVTTSVV